MTSQSDLVSAIGVPNGSIPLPGMLTAGQPSAGQLEQLARAGIKTVIDLRPQEEPRGFDEPATARAAGLAYHNIPVSAATLGDKQFDEFRKLVGAGQEGMMLVHCGSANRVGALLIPYMMIDQGRTREDALHIARGVGLRSDDLAQMAIAYAEKRTNKSAT